MATIATDDGTSSAHGDSAYSGLPNKLVRAANGIDHAYRDTGPGASGSAPLVRLQHFRGNLDNWDPALIDATRTRRTGSCSSTTRNSRPMSRPSSLTLANWYQEGEVVADLLGTVVEAHGGHKRWNELETVTAHLAQGGVLWALKGQQGVLDDVFVTASLHEERESHYPFGAAGRRSVFTPERVAIETADGTVVEALEQPRASFAGHTAETPWTTLQLAYFVGTAMWTYLTQPFTFTLPGFETAELEPWQENGEQWRRLRVVWPSCLATHSAVQTVYVGDDGLIRRKDYDVDILGGSMGAHYMSGYTRVAGIMIPTGHRIFPRTPEGRALTEPLLVSIDLSEITFA